MPDDADIGLSVADLGRKLVEVKVRIEEVAVVLAALLEGEVLAIRLGEEELLPLRRRRRDAVLLADVLAAPFRALGVHHRLALVDLLCAGFPGVLLLAD